jgi:peptidyl-prolyl cis-trans isomerase SurA
MVMSHDYRILSLLFVALCGLSPTFAQTGRTQQRGIEAWEERYSNGIAAVVEGRAITMEMIREKMAPIIPQIAREARSQQEFQMRVDQLAREILQNEVDRVLIIEEFRDNEEMQIPRSVVENQFDQRLQQDFDGDRSRLLSYLQEQNKTMREFRREIMEEIIVVVMRQEQRRSQAEISPEKIEQFYFENKIRFFQEESIRMRQIVLSKYADESTEVLLQNARDLIRRLEQGAAFSDLARRYSQDEMASSGGDWGWINRSDIREDLAEVAFSLEAGEWSEPFEMSGSVFILYAEEKRDEGIQPLAEVRERIEDFLLREISREAQEQWLERLRDDGFVRYYL